MDIYMEPKKGKTGAIVIDDKEASIILDAITEYCDAHKRRKLARKIMKQMEDEFAFF